MRVSASSGLIEKERDRVEGERTYKTSPMTAPSSMFSRSCGVTPYCTRRYRKMASVKAPGPVESS